MDGIHDLGGLSGFGAVDVESGEPTFHERWEAIAFAFNILGISVLRAYNVDEYRHAVERMEPRHYLAASYYERVLTGVATLARDFRNTTRRGALHVPRQSPASAPARCAIRRRWHCYRNEVAPPARSARDLTEHPNSDVD